MRCEKTEWLRLSRKTFELACEAPSHDYNESPLSRLRTGEHPESYRALTRTPNAWRDQSAHHLPCCICGACAASVTAANTTDIAQTGLALGAHPSPSRTLSRFPSAARRLAWRSSNLHGVHTASIDRNVKWPHLALPQASKQLHSWLKSYQQWHEVK